MKHIFILAILFVTACSQKQDTIGNVSGKDTVKPIVASERESARPPTEIVELFADSTNIGKKGKCMIELIKHRVFDDKYVIVKFYIKNAYGKDTNRWVTQNSYIYECDAHSDFEPDISDYNNDTFNDITFVSGQAARMSNEVRRLFLYDDKGRELISIVNSEDYPNMQYNKTLDCIDALMITGGASTVFARIAKDSLIEFAGVDCFGWREVYEIDKSGKKKILQIDSISDFEEIFVRYKNYKPLTLYEN